VISFPGSFKSYLDPAQPSASEIFESVGLNTATQAHTYLTISGGLLRALSSTKSFYLMTSRAFLQASRMGIEASKISSAYFFCLSIFSLSISNSFCLTLAFSFFTDTISVFSLTYTRISSTSAFF